MKNKIRPLGFALAMILAAFAGREIGLSNGANLVIMTALIATFIATGSGKCGEGCAR